MRLPKSTRDIALATPGIDSRVETECPNYQINNFNDLAPKQILQNYMDENV